MRAKPEMEPWVHTDKSGLSSVGAALTDKKHCQARQDDYICYTKHHTIWDNPFLNFMCI